MCLGVTGGQGVWSQTLVAANSGTDYMHARGEGVGNTCTNRHLGRSGGTINWGMESTIGGEGAGDGADGWVP